MMGVPGIACVGECANRSQSCVVFPVSDLTVLHCDSANKAGAGTIDLLLKMERKEQNCSFPYVIRPASEELILLIFPEIF